MRCDVPGADPARVAAGRSLLLSDDTYVRLADFFRAFADVSRAKVVHSLLRQELCTCDLASIVGLSEPAVSQHLRLLRVLRLVKTRREGKKVYYSLADAHVRFVLGVSLRHLEHADGALDDALNAAPPAGEPAGADAARPPAGLPDPRGGPAGDEEAEG